MIVLIHLKFIKLRKKMKEFLIIEILKKNFLNYLKNGAYVK